MDFVFLNCRRLSFCLLFFTVIFSRLTVLQWKCRSIITNLGQLVQHVSRHRFEVLCLQSLSCRPSSLLRLDAYSYLPVLGPVPPAGKVMVCTDIRNNIRFSVSSNVAGAPSGYSCGVRVRVQGQPYLTAVSCYTPDTCTSFDWLKELGGNGRCSVTGDFNVRDSSWERGYESSSPTLTAQIK